MGRQSSSLWLGPLFRTVPAICLTGNWRSPFFFLKNCETAKKANPHLKQWVFCLFSGAPLGGFGLGFSAVGIWTIHLPTV